MNTRELLEYPKLYDFFVVQKNIYKILPIVKREKKKTAVSLSLLEWFVINYVKKYRITYTVNRKVFDVYIEYKSQLADYHKEYFDPFNRGVEPVPFRYGPNEEDYIMTTFKQLNFLRWAFKNKIIRHVEENIEKIKEDYKNSKEEKKKKMTEQKESKKPVKKRSLYVESPKYITLRQEKTKPFSHLKYT